ncbi:MAG TPA: protein-glutamine glutaminase family protein, partial [Methanothrix sp.]
MSNPNALVDNVRDLSQPKEALAALSSETLSQTITVSFQGGRSGLLNKANPRSAVWSKRLALQQQRGMPVYVEIDTETNIITELLIPETSKVWALTPEATGDIEVNLIPSPSRHYILRSNPDFESMSNALQSAKEEGTKVLVTTTRDTHEIIDVRQLPKPQASEPLPESAPSPAPDGAPAPVTEQRAKDLFDLMNSRSCDCAVIPPCIPFKYPTDGCYARAHEMCRLMIGEGEQPEKVWIYASSDTNLRPKAPNDPDCQVSWWYHVAPTLLVTMPSGTEKKVIDPSLCSGPVSPDEWRDLQEHIADLKFT